MKHPYIAKRYWKEQTTAMGQSDVVAKSFDDVINLSLGEPDLTTDERIIDAAFAADPVSCVFIICDRMNLKY